MALPSKLCAALHGQSNVGSCVIASHAEVCTCQFWSKFSKELKVIMVQVLEVMVMPIQGQHYVQ